MNQLVHTQKFGHLPAISLYVFGHLPIRNPIYYSEKRRFSLEDVHFLLGFSLEDVHLSKYRKTRASFTNANVIP